MGKIGKIANIKNNGLHKRGLSAVFMILIVMAISISTISALELNPFAYKKLVEPATKDININK